MKIHSQVREILSMKFTKYTLIPLTLFALFIFYYSSINLIPFHPDESTQLFMSKDFRLLISNPLALAWDKDKSTSKEQTYRELDAPLTRYAIGFGRTVFNIPDLIADWDWSKTWNENILSGALPSNRQLLISRGIITFFLPFSALLIFWIGKKIQGNTLGFIAAFLLTINPLVLLHCRRGMAEGILLLGVISVLSGAILGERYPWLTGLTMGIAFNAKQSTMAIIPIAFLSVVWFSSKPNKYFKSAIKNSIIFFASFLGIFILLNPIYLSNPTIVLKESIAARSNLLKDQTQQISSIAPDHILQSPTERAIVPLANIFITNISFSEIGNYLQNTKLEEDYYLAIPYHNLFRGLFWGSISFFLMLFGIIITILSLNHVAKKEKRILTLLLLAFFMQYLFFIMFVPLTWQRYVIPLIPYVCLFTAIGIIELGKVVSLLISKYKNHTL